MMAVYNLFLKRQFAIWLPSKFNSLKHA